MKKLTTEQVRELLSSRRVEPTPDAQAFWADFRARARLMNQDQPVPVPAFSMSTGKWALAAACAMFVAVFGGLFMFHSPAGQEPAASMTLDVEVAHSAVLVIEDAPSQSTIVWIVDMKDGNDGGSA